MVPGGALDPLDNKLPGRQSQLQALTVSIFHSINLEYLLSYKDKEGKRPSLTVHTVCLCDGNMGSHEGTAGTGEVQGGNQLKQGVLGGFLEAELLS